MAEIWYDDNPPEAIVPTSEQFVSQACGIILLFACLQLAVLTEQLSQKNTLSDFVHWIITFTS